MLDLGTHLKKVLQEHGAAAGRTEDLWKEITEAYSTSSRHYHNMHHLQHVHAQLLKASSLAQDMGALVLATAYHDIVQSMMRKDDEARSADLMRERIVPLAVPKAMVERAAAHILATKEHASSNDPDSDLFTDADLSILGTPRIEYALYAQQVRKEYHLVPDILYKVGRKKALQQFLDLPMIFKTPAFIQLEEQARKNIHWELDHL